MQTIAKVILKRQGRHGSESGHPWVFQSEIDYIKGKFTPGDIVDVFNARRQYLGRGYINPRSQITVRLLSRDEEMVDRDFFVRRISRAWAYRQRPGRPRRSAGRPQARPPSVAGDAPARVGSDCSLPLRSLASRGECKRFQPCMGIFAKPLARSPNAKPQLTIESWFQQYS